MTPKEKASELYSIYYNRIEHTLSEEYSPHEKGIVKECALIALDEIKKILMSLYKPEYTSFNTVNELMYQFEEGAECDVMDGYDMVMYYDEVKQEIEKL